MKIRIIKLHILLLAFFTCDFVFAYTLGANQNLNISNPSGGLSFNFAGQSGSQAGKVYTILFGTNGTGSLGSISNGKFDTVAFNVLLSSATIMENINGVNTPITGNLSGALNISYNNVDVNVGANQAAAIGGTATGTANFSMTGTINGQSVTMGTTAMMPQFMDFALNQHGPAYNNTINAFSNGNLNFAMNIDGLEPRIDTWLKGNASIIFNGQASAFNFGGDLHSQFSQNTTQVPEPTTVGLLLSGLFSGLISRKKKLAKNL